jgi:dihydroorotate dehydrogenase electron transfer subunit
MKDTYFKLIENKEIASNTYLSVLEGDTSDITASGQFVNIKLDGLYLRRPISVCNVEGNKLTIISKAVGVGTEKMASTP